MELFEYMQRLNAAHGPAGDEAGIREVIMELADPSRAGVILPVDQEDEEDLLMLLMPMMLND